MADSEVQPKQNEQEDAFTEIPAINPIKTAIAKMFKKQVHP